MRLYMYAWNPQDIFSRHLDLSNAAQHSFRALQLRHTEAHQSAIQSQLHSRQLSEVEGDAREKGWPHH